MPWVEQEVDPEFMEYIKNYIEQHFDQKLDFKELAHMSGYSSDYFRHLFRAHFGVSPQEYMIDARLQKAKALLEEGHLSCTEVSYKCGFSNSAQLSTMFKKKFGCSPSAVR